MATKFRSDAVLEQAVRPVDSPTMMAELKMWTDSGEISVEFLRQCSQQIPECVRDDCIIEWMQYVDELRKRKTPIRDMTGEVSRKITRTINEERGPSDLE